MRVNGAVAGALAAALALAPAARAASPKELEQEAQQKAEEARRRAEQSAPGTPAPLDDARRGAIGAALAWSQLTREAGKLAGSKGESKEVKDLGKSLERDEQRASDDIGRLVSQRGTNPASLPPGPDRDRVNGELAALGKSKGGAFDQAFVDFLVRNLPAYKDAAGRARDATPGSDADLKWSLDQLERLVIAHRDAARQLSTRREQAKARTPPPLMRPMKK